MTWTPLHAALGETSSDFTYELVAQACEQGLPEQADMDWKRTLPLTAGRDSGDARRGQQDELAKDIAAMANSGGGLIVYGVAESSNAGSSAASSIESVSDVNDETTRNIRRVAGSSIYPPVVGLQFFHVSKEDDPEQQVLAMLVPASLEAPHLIHPRHSPDWFAAPYRHGPDTQWMVERQLASAYTSRESEHRRAQEDLGSRFTSFLDALSGDRAASWIVIVITPDVARGRSETLSRPRAEGVFTQSTGWPLAVADSLGPADLLSSANTRRGLRRFYRMESRRITRADASPRARAEVHADGTVAVAFTRDGAVLGEGRQPGHVVIEDIENVAVYAFNVLWNTRRRLGVTSNYGMRLAIHPGTQVFRRMDPHVLGHLVPWDERNRVFGYAPVEGSIVMSEGLDRAVSSYVDVVTDAVNQAGAECNLDAGHLITEITLNTD